MRFAIIILGSCLMLASPSKAQSPPIGQWREHLNYRPAIQVIKADQVYCATATNLFAVDAQDEMQRFSKMTGLHDIGISCVGWDDLSSQLVIAYNNSNIDVLKKQSVTNIGDIKRSTIAGNKSIHHIFCSNGLAYLSSGLGIIVVNLIKYEIKDTWFIGASGAPVNVHSIAADADFFYAATDEGLKKASRLADLSDYRNWTTLSGSNGLPGGNTNAVVVAANQLIAQKNDSLFIASGNNWSLLYTDTVWSLNSITPSGNKLLVCQQNNTGKARVLQLATNGNIEKIITNPALLSHPLSAIIDAGKIWVADSLNGLSRFTATGADRFIPNGPPGTATGEMMGDGKQLFAAAGSINNNWQPQHNRNGIFQLTNNEWNFYRYDNTPALSNTYDFITVAIDPVDQTLWAGSFGSGLAHFKNNNVSIYQTNNSALQAAMNNPGSYQVGGLAFGQNNHLWISNYGAAKELVVRKADSSWKAFAIPFPHTENAVGQVLIDDADQVWIISPKGNGIFCYNHGASIDNTNDDQWKFYQQGNGKGNLPSNNVLCMAKDKNGFIWIGTDKGIGIVQCTGNVFSPQGCDALLPVVQQDRFAGLLFRDEMVQCIAVDGANRKWVGTRNGLWLLSQDGTSIVYRFTSDNSQLLNNDIRKLAIDPHTGEVFIETAMGICSFRSTATEGGPSNQDVLVFPNPVPPGYNGTIAVRGLTNNALVKITELNGRLVYQTRALGGQAIWDGRTYLGNKVASGIYLVIVRSDSGDDKIVTKIAITSGR
ncbi:two-component regulator propeller domain-containing protein [Asinibacterium sp. OR53]|uniref:type IX secretion system anionic LPS delivery protein PorZ n=1 Tax=Asinibacterium sp. OR53 TaxID=925409 RepID=UPI00056326D7|nr:two-component regulator propeller domain-containing protein [Asinibacterium sp. OR53]